MRAIVTALLVVASCVACRSAPPRGKLEQNPKATAPDRLAPGESLPDRETVFGLEVPNGLRVGARFPEFVQLTGQVQPEAVANYFRKHVVAEHVELGANRMVFPRVFIEGDAKKRVFRIDITNDRRMTHVKIRDITHEPVPQGLSERERWERAGRNPDGTMKNRLEVY